MKEKLFILFLLVFSVLISNAQESTDSTKQQKKERWSLGAVPAIAYDSDLGFKYGAVLNLFHYGKPSIYPNYKHNIYLEWSQTTKGNGIRTIFYDSKYLLPKKIRLTVNLENITDKALDFYGFNGYESEYNSAIEKKSDTANYISRLYYRHECKTTRFQVELKNKIGDSHFQWLTGIGFLHFKTSSVDIEKLNKGKKEEDKLPNVPGLYDKYVEWGIIPLDVKDGGRTNYLSLGAIYDSRDKEANPTCGTWTEAVLQTIPKFLGNKSNYSYSLVYLVHRHYIPLFTKRLILAGRIAYQGKISGNMPWYMLPTIWSTYQTTYGYGGAKSVRGVLRNRVVGDGVAYYNLELRWNFLQTVIKKQNFGITWSLFADGAKVTNRFKFIQTSGIDIKTDAEKFHNSFGTGIHLIYNENFIVAIDYGRALDRRDGIQGLYINLNFLY